jgi:hypothetical protein
MQAAALRREAMETIGYYVQWKTNEYLGMEWGDRDRRLYIGHLRQRALRAIRTYKNGRAGYGQ